MQQFPRRRFKRRIHPSISIRLDPQRNSSLSSAFPGREFGADTVEFNADRRPLATVPEEFQRVQIARVVCDAAGDSITQRNI